MRCCWKIGSAAEALREIRLDGAATLVLLALAFYGYGAHWPLLFLALLARGFLISFLDNVYHYETPVSDIFYAKNLRLAAPLAKLLLNFNFHGIHHVNPAIPWLHLPRAFEAQAGRYYGGYFAAALRQLRGPIALQDLPHGAAVARIRPCLTFFFEQQDGKPFARVGEVLDRAEVKEAELLLQADRIEFAADLDENLFVFLPLESGGDVGKRISCRARGDGIHFDLLPFGIEPGVVAHVVARRNCRRAID